MLIKNFLALVCCLVGGGNSIIAETTKVNFNVIEQSEGTIASTTPGVVKEITSRGLKNAKVRAV